MPEPSRHFPEDETSSGGGCPTLVAFSEVLQHLPREYSKRLVNRMHQSLAPTFRLSSRTFFRERRHFGLCDACGGIYPLPP